jgi:uncharacterized repeat protein (TIGR01451 family)
MIHKLLALTVMTTAVAITLATSASAASGDITLASTSDGGTKGNNVSQQVSISADGTKVAFSSSATNLDPKDTDLNTDVYVKDLLTGNIALASTNDAGTKGIGNSDNPSLSADGTKIAFESSATNLDPADTGVTEDVYVKDLLTGNITLASSNDSGIKGNSTSGAPTLSADGTKVAFMSDARNLDPSDTDFNMDVYVKDVVTGNLTLASTDGAGIKGNRISGAPILSADGTAVAFSSSATNLDPADTDAIGDVYVKDLFTGNITVASTDDSGTKGNGSSSARSLSADGDTVAFDSNATNLDPRDTDVNKDVYAKDLPTGNLTLVSTDDAGIKANGISEWPSVSGDGTRVAFQSYATNLDSGDTDVSQDVYVKDLPTEDITLASSDRAGIKGNGNSARPSLDADGTAVAFNSGSTNLLPDDTDVTPDVYVKELQGAVSSADLSITMSDSPDPVSLGQTVTYTVDVANAGPDQAAGVTVTVPLPAGVTYGSASPSQGTCSQALVAVVCLLGAVPAGGSASVDIHVVPTSAGTITATGSLTSSTSDPDATNNIDSADTAVQAVGRADLKVRMRDSHEPVRVGRRLRYWIRIRNRGPESATGVTVVDPLPTGVSLVSVSSRQGACSEVSGVVTCNLGGLASGAHARITIRVRPNSPGTISNTASVAANEADPNIANNQDTETTEVI